MKKLLSIVFPIYNVEKYLEECINSVLHQADERCELILVDDGSLDSSGSIADGFAANSPLVRVIHKENGGLSSARNAGLANATGKFVMFIDSDDRIAPNSLLPILDNAVKNNYDLCFLRSVKFYPDGRVTDMAEKIDPKHFTNDPSKNIRYLSSRPKFPGSACTKIYNTEFLKKNDIHFPYDRRLSEDLGFILRCIYKAKKIGSFDSPFYEYRQQREGSITSSATVKTFEGLQLFITESAEMLCREKKPVGKTEKYLMSFVAYEFAILMYRNALCEWGDKDFVRQNAWILRYGKSVKGRIIYLFERLFGIRLTSELLVKIRS